MTEPLQPSQFRRRGYFPSDEDVLRIVRKLRQLEIDTQPNQGAGSEKDKGVKAVVALSLADPLCDWLFGWAIDHTIGEAGKTDGTLSNVAETAPHEHELWGSDYQFNDPVVNRRAAAMLLRFAPGPDELYSELSHALRALDFGEVQAILRTNGRRRGPSYTLAQLRLRAVEHIEFRRGFDTKKVDAMGEVASAYGVSAHTIVNWKARECPRVIGKTGTSEIADIAYKQGEFVRATYLQLTPTEDDMESARALREDFETQLSFDGAHYQGLHREVAALNKGALVHTLANSLDDDL